MSQKQTITLVLYGVPRPGGSKTSIPIIRGYKPTGKPILGVRVFDAGKDAFARPARNLTADERDGALAHHVRTTDGRG